MHRLLLLIVSCNFRKLSLLFFLLNFKWLIIYFTDSSAWSSLLLILSTFLLYLLYSWAPELLFGFFFPLPPVSFLNLILFIYYFSDFIEFSFCVLCHWAFLKGLLNSLLDKSQLSISLGLTTRKLVFL